MKRLMILFSFLCTYTSPLFLYAQCPSAPVINITGNTCLGSILTTQSNAPAGSSIIWKRNGIMLDTPQIIPVPAGVTVAGGNGSGSNANQLNTPTRIFIDKAGNIYIPDMNNNRIQKWAPGATSGVTVAGGNGVGSAANQFNRPSSVALNSNGDLLIADQANNRIQKWPPGATSGTTIIAGLNYPTGIFIDAQDNIYVSEQFGSIVTKWSTTNVRTVVAGGNGYGSAANQLSAPTGIFVDAAGNVYICDTDNNRVQKWPPGSTTGITVAGGNGLGSAANQLLNPIAVFVDDSGNLFISDFSNYRVQRWAMGATSGITVAGGNGSGSGANQLNQPHGIYLDAACNLYVSDFFNARVQKFTSQATSTFTALFAGDYTATYTTPTGVTIISNIISVGISKTPSVTIGASATTICNGENVTFTATPTNAGTAPVFQWQKNGINTGTNSALYVDNFLKNGDVITCKLTSNDICVTTAQAVSNAVAITVKQIPEQLNLGPDTTICEGEQIVLNAGQGYSSYLWKGGSTDSQFTVTQPGQYYVQVQGDCNTVFSDTVIVTYSPTPKIFLPDTLLFCPNNTLNLIPTSSFIKYLWSTNEITQSITITKTGLYWLEVVNENNCVGKDTTIVLTKDCIKKLYVPSGFTPNNDGKNDLLKPVFFDAVTLIRFDIYNRWGERIFHSKDINKGWDGTIKGQPQQASSYVWVCTYQFRGQPIATEKGTVILIR